MPLSKILPKDQSELQLGRRSTARDGFHVSSVRMNADGHSTPWFQHFLQDSKPSAEETIHTQDNLSHTKNLDVIELARANHVIIVVILPHISHRLQPLDVGFMKHSARSTHRRSRSSSGKTQAAWSPSTRWLACSARPTTGLKRHLRLSTPSRNAVCIPWTGISSQGMTMSHPRSRTLRALSQATCVSSSGEDGVSSSGEDGPSTSLARTRTVIISDISPADELPAPTAKAGTSAPASKKRKPAGWPHRTDQLSCKRALEVTVRNSTSPRCGSKMGSDRKPKKAGSRLAPVTVRMKR